MSKGVVIALAALFCAVPAKTVFASGSSGERIVVLDPGHQGSWVDMSAQEPVAPGSSQTKAKATSGTQGAYSQVPEYELNLQVALVLKEVLEDRGYQVVLTREDNDTAISNKERAQLATDVGADISVRIHANGSEDSSVSGALTMAPSEENPYVGGLAAESRRLAQAVLDHYCEATGLANQGILLSDTMTGINWSTVPVTILEMGYMSNEADDLYLTDQSHHQTMAQGIADGIDAYFAEQEAALLDPENLGSRETQTEPAGESGTGAALSDPENLGSRETQTEPAGESGTGAALSDPENLGSRETQTEPAGESGTGAALSDPENLGGGETRTAAAGDGGAQTAGEAAEGNANAFPDTGLLGKNLAGVPEAVTPADTMEPLAEILKEGWLDARSQAGEKWSVAVLDLTTGGSCMLNAGEQMQSASVAKLFIMGAVYERILYPEESGKTPIEAEESYEGEIRELLSQMITVSDNDAANRLTELLGEGSFEQGAAVVDAFCEEHGFSATHLGRRFLAENPTDDNYTSAGDCASFLEAVYREELVTKEASEEMLELLKGQTRTGKIPAGVPDSVVTANKTGEMPPGLGLGSIENDAALILDEEKPYVLCVLSNDISDNGRAQEDIAAISAAVWDFLEEARE